MNSDRKEEILLRMKIRAEERERHKAKLESEYGLVGHPKADKLYELAWGYGHSSGYTEVEYYYSELVELLDRRD